MSDHDSDDIYGVNGMKLRASIFIWDSFIPGAAHVKGLRRIEQRALSPTAVGLVHNVYRAAYLHADVCAWQVHDNLMLETLRQIHHSAPLNQ